jgi:hypothetical protein
MALLKAPDCGVAITVSVAAPPGVIASVDGLAAIVNFVGGGATHVAAKFTAPDIVFAMLGFPTACTCRI